MKKLYNVFRFWLAVQFPKIRKYFLTEDENKKMIIYEFRAIAMLFGCDTSKMSDIQIAQSVTNTALQIQQFGISMSDAGEALRRLNLKFEEHFD